MKRGKIPFARSAYNRFLIRRDPVRFARHIGVTIGNDCRLIGLRPWTFGSEPYLVTLGNHVTVAGGVRFVTHDGGAWIFRDLNQDLNVIAPITIGSNVFIGMLTIILPGVAIGDNVVVGAGSIVTKNIPSGCVVAGCPAHVIKTVDAYRARVMERAVNLPALSPQAKREFLTNIFSSVQASPSLSGPPGGD